MKQALIQTFWSVPDPSNAVKTDKYSVRNTLNIAYVSENVFDSLRMKYLNTFNSNTVILYLNTAHLLVPCIITVAYSFGP